MLKKILIGLLIVFIIAQFIQPTKNKGAAFSPADITHAVTVPDSVMAVLKVSCFDCHSNHTNYPWYSRITPVNWWLKNHIDEGKEHLNFTEFTRYSLKEQDHQLEEIGETVENHSMPLDSYLWVHKEADLSEAERNMLVNWVKKARAGLQQ